MQNGKRSISPLAVTGIVLAGIVLLCAGVIAIAALSRSAGGRVVATADTRTQAERDATAVARQMEIINARHTAEAPAVTATPDNENLWWAGMLATKQSLKAPSTAKFSSLGDDGTSYSMRPDGSCDAYGYVDSQNSFGAMLRNKWHAIVKRRDAGYKVIYLEIGKDIIIPLSISDNTTPAPAAQIGITSTTGVSTTAEYLKQAGELRAIMTMLNNLSDRTSFGYSLALDAATEQALVFYAVTPPAQFAEANRYFKETSDFLRLAQLDIKGKDWATLDISLYNANDAYQAGEKALANAR